MGITSQQTYLLLTTLLESGATEISNRHVGRHSRLGVDGNKG
jgi:hypothetical protein